MEHTQLLESPVLDKIEVFIPPRITLKIVTLATERGQTLNEIILDALNEYINKSKQ